MCQPCYHSDLAKQQQAQQRLRWGGTAAHWWHVQCMLPDRPAQGLRCSGCGAEGKLIVSNGLCRPCSRKHKAEAAQRAAIGEYMAVKGQELKPTASKAKEAGQQKRVRGGTTARDTRAMLSDNRSINFEFQPVPTQ